MISIAKARNWQVATFVAVSLSIVIWSLWKINELNSDVKNLEDIRLIQVCWTLSVVSGMCDQDRAPIAKDVSNQAYNTICSLNEPGRRHPGLDGLLARYDKFNQDNRIQTKILQYLIDEAKPRPTFNIDEPAALWNDQ